MHHATQAATHTATRIKRMLLLIPRVTQVQHVTYVQQGHI